MRFAHRSLVLAAALVVPAGAAPDPLAAIAAANGHQAALHLRFGATTSVEGRAVVVTFDREGSRALLRRCVAEACSGTWFDGERAWTFGLNDVALPVDDGRDPQRRTLWAILSYAFAEPAFRAAGGTVEPIAPGRWRVQAPDGDPLTAVVDATRAVRLVQTAEGTAIAAFSGEARAGAVRVWLNQRFDENDERFGTAGIVAEPLRAPAGASATFAGDPSVPFGMTGIPIVPCTLAGRGARCLLDTGATPSAVTLAFAEALGLEPHGELELQGFGGASSFVTGFIESGPLALGAARFAAARFAVIPPVAQSPFDVVVGADLLARVKVVFDGARRIATVGAPGDAAAAGAIPLRYRHGVPHLRAALGGTPFDAVLDSGDASLVSLGYAQYHDGPQWPLVERVSARGVAGGGAGFVVQGPALALGATAIGPARVTVALAQAEPHVGFGLTARCLVVLDEAHRALSCTAR